MTRFPGPFRTWALSLVVVGMASGLVQGQEPAPLPKAPPAQFDPNRLPQPGNANGGPEPLAREVNQALTDFGAGVARLGPEIRRTTDYLQSMPVPTICCVRTRSAYYGRIWNVAARVDTVKVNADGKVDKVDGKPEPRMDQPPILIRIPRAY